MPRDWEDKDFREDSREGRLIRLEGALLIAGWLLGGALVVRLMLG